MTSKTAGIPEVGQFSFDLLLAGKTALMDLGTPTGKAAPTGADIWIKNYDLAALVGVTRYAVSSLLHQEEEERLIEKHRGGVLIRCPEKLISASDNGSEKAVTC
jgi:hypothetical protein